jgi:hypothetical protein
MRRLAPAEHHLNIVTAHDEIDDAAEELAAAHPDSRCTALREAARHCRSRCS